MELLTKRQSSGPIPMISPVDREIRDFLTGKTDGEDLLHQLYDHVLDEAIPERLRAVLRG